MVKGRKTVKTEEDLGTYSTQKMAIIFVLFILVDIVHQYSFWHLKLRELVSLF